MLFHWPACFACATFYDMTPLEEIKLSVADSHALTTALDFATHFDRKPTPFAAHAAVLRGKSAVWPWFSAALQNLMSSVGRHAHGRTLVERPSRPY